MSGVDRFLVVYWKKERIVVSEDCGADGVVA
jgi:hypothetical protein